jgi:hypothetical protein
LKDISENSRKRSILKIPDEQTSYKLLFIATTLFTEGNVFEVRKVLNSNNIISSNIAMLVLIFFMIINQYPSRHAYCL